jgi:hypothetical protein
MNDMHRSSDESTTGAVASERSFITIDRRIPLPWLLGSLAAIVVSWGTMYFQQKQTSEKVSEVAGDVKQIRTDVATQGMKSLEDNISLRDLNRRVTATEVKIDSLQVQQSAAKK